MDIGNQAGTIFTTRGILKGSICIINYINVNSMDIEKKIKNTNPKSKKKTPEIKVNFLLLLFYKSYKFKDGFLGINEYAAIPETKFTKKLILFLCLECSI